MSIFGWSLPPGCGTLPGEEQGAVDITDIVWRKPLDVFGVFWDEDDNLIEAFPVTVPADPHNGTPEYTEQQNCTVGEFEWDDDMSDYLNFVAAATYYSEVLT